jgi:hypothetical protein
VSPQAKLMDNNKSFWEAHKATYLEDSEGEFNSSRDLLNASSSTFG